MTPSVLEAGIFFLFWLSGLLSGLPSKEDGTWIGSPMFRTAVVSFGSTTHWQDPIIPKILGKKNFKNSVAFFLDPKKKQFIKKAWHLANLK